MGVPVNRYQRHTKLDDPTSPVLYYLRQVPGTFKTITMRTIAQRMERVGSLSAPDAMHVMENFMIEVKNELIEGNKVKVEGLGTFHMTFCTEGTEEERDCTVKKIKRVNVRFVVDNALRLVNDSTATTRGAANNVQFYIKGSSPSGNDNGNENNGDDDFIDPEA